jgi:NAD(P)-dependent dehydrogenase (short-subunit alcohol dehydrogenase family)
MHEQFDSPRSSEDVFRYIADFSRIHEWDHTIVSAKKVSTGPIQLGTKFELVYKQGFRKVPIQYTITEFTPQHKLKMTGIAASFTAVDTVTIDQDSDGCHVDWHTSIVFRGVAAKLIPLFENRIKRAGAQTIQDLANALKDENPAPTATSLQKLADTLILPGMYGFTKFGYQRAKKNWKPITANLHGKRVLITGGTSGLGLAAASELASMGANVCIVGRDAGKCQSIVADIIERTGNSSVEFEIADLSLIGQVKSLAQRLNDQSKAIDVLVNNAGALLNPRQTTSEGLETSFALLLLSPYVLTNALLPLLKKSTSARIINVSSGGMYAKRISVANLESSKGEYSGSDAYARAKRGLVIMGEEWAKDWGKFGITVHNMHPGWALTPGLEVGLPEFTTKMRRVLRSSEEGADTIIWLAAASEVTKTTGLFWLDRVPHTTHLSAKTKETPEQRSALVTALKVHANAF